MLLHEYWKARHEAAMHAIKRLEFLKNDTSLSASALERIAGHYHARLELLRDGPHTPLKPDEAPGSQNHPAIVGENRIWKEVLDAEREAIVCLRQNFAISDDVMHDMLGNIDLLHNHYSGRL